MPTSITPRGTHLTDLIFIEEGNSDDRDGKINFRKRRQIYEVIDLLQSFNSGANYDFDIIEPLHSYLAHLPSLSENDLYSLSLHYEPRDE